MYGIFKKLLDDNGVRTSDVARATGIPPSTFSDWKKGKSEPKKDKIQKICSYFNEPITLFYGESDDNLMGTNVVKEDSPNYDVDTIAAHKSNVEWTPEELRRIEEYMKLLLAARDNKSN
jgi:transcriptional regulator with XRE-family HTH domain